MRRSIFNVFTVAAGAVLVAALGVSAHAQISNVIPRAGVHSQVTTLHTEKAEVATEAPEAQDADNDNNDDQGDNNDEQGDSGDGGDAGGD